MKFSRSQEVQNVLLLTLVLHVSLATAQFLAAWKLMSLPLMASSLYSVMGGAASVISIVTLQAASERYQSKELHPSFIRFTILSTMIVSGILVLCGWEILVSSYERVFLKFPAATFSWFGIGLLAGVLIMNAAIPQIEKKTAVTTRSGILGACAAIKEWGAVPPGIAIAGILVTQNTWIYADAAATVLIILLNVPTAFRIVEMGIFTSVLTSMTDPEIRHSRDPLGDYDE